MFDTTDLGLFQVLQSSLSGQFQRSAADAALQRGIQSIASDFRLEDCLLLQRYIDLYRLETSDPLKAKEFSDSLRQKLELSFAQDPSDHNMLYVLALYDLEGGAATRAVHRLRKVAASGYRAASRARAVLDAHHPTT